MAATAPGSGVKSREVRIRGIQVNTLAGRKKSYTVRWVVGTGPKSRTFGTRALADNFRSDLMQAANRVRRSTATPGCLSR